MRGIERVHDSKQAHSLWGSLRTHEFLQAHPGGSWGSRTHQAFLLHADVVLGSSGAQTCARAGVSVLRRLQTCDDALMSSRTAPKELGATVFNRQPRHRKEASKASEPSARLRGRLMSIQFHLEMFLKIVFCMQF